MAEPKFESSLTMEEIESNFQGVDFFAGMMEGLEEALAFGRGTASPETLVRKRSLPDINVAEVRNSLNMTQKVFASMLGVSCRTVEAWESGKTNPSPTAKKLMFLIREDHSVVQKLL